MARKPNPVKSVQITVSTTPLVHGYLSALVDTGLYGKNPAEAAERLIAKGIEVALDMDQILYEATMLLNAASLINRIGQQS